MGVSRWALRRFWGAGDIEYALQLGLFFGGPYRVWGCRDSSIFGGWSFWRGGEKSSCGEGAGQKSNCLAGTAIVVGGGMRMLPFDVRDPAVLSAVYPRDARLGAFCVTGARGADAGVTLVARGEEGMPPPGREVQVEVMELRNGPPRFPLGGARGLGQFFCSKVESFGWGTVEGDCVGYFGGVKGLGAPCPFAAFREGSLGFS